MIVITQRRLKPPVADEVHVWQVEVDNPSDVQADFVLLSGEEMDRARRFRHFADRQRFVRCRAALRRILAGYLGERPEELTILYGRYGKPMLARPLGDELRFSVTHSDGLALVAVASLQEVGVDVERVLPRRLDALTQRFCGPEELSEIQSLPRDRQLRGFLRLWTAKEAYVKGLGVGLRIDPRRLVVSMDGDGRRELTLRCPLGDGVKGTTGDPTMWSLAAVDVSDAYVATLAVWSAGGRRPCVTVRSLSHRPCFAGA